MYEQTSMSVQCNIILNNGYVCGLPPIGRCAFCQRAFCGSHQASDRLGVYPDVCVPCYPKTYEGKQEQARRDESEAYAYFHSGTARTDLLTARVQPVEIYQVVHHQEIIRTGILRRHNSYNKVKKVTFSGRGWLLGEFFWRYAVAPFRLEGPVPEEAGIKYWLTALLDISPDDLSSNSSLKSCYWNNNFVRVRPRSEGYEHPGSWYEWPEPYDPNHDRFEGTLVAARQAVKRLIAESS